MKTFEVKRRLKVRLYFKWYDLWIGAYIDTETRTVYIGIPMVGVQVRIEEYRICEFCHKEMSKFAHHTGDGWMLHWDCGLWCSDADDRFIEWHFGSRWLSGEQLEDFGYEVV